MGSLHIPHISFEITPRPLPDTRVQFTQTPDRLADAGLNFPAMIFQSHASPSVDGADDAKSSIEVPAHLDTGASITAIDATFAEYLNLTPTGSLCMRSASGTQDVDTYTVDLYFPDTTLSPFLRLPICSCHLGFNVNGDFNDPKNFALLIGRDVMARWSIFWNGPISAVTIND